MIFVLQDALKQLWKLAYPDRKLPGLKSELWKEMGWQGPDPSTDFRCVIRPIYPKGSNLNINYFIFVFRFSTKNITCKNFHEETNHVILSCRKHIYF